MSHKKLKKLALAGEIPEVIVIPNNMLMYWSSKLKIAIIILALLIYVYFLLFIKTVYLKGKRLDRIMEMAEKTEKMMKNVQNMDQKLAMKLEHLNQLYEDY